MKHMFQIGAVYVKDFTFTATTKTISVHKFQHKCAVQLGDPDNGQPGIEFEGNVVFEIDPRNKGQRQTGMLEIIQNVNFAWKRTPPLHPKAKSKLQFECRNSNNQWYYDGSKAENARLGPKPKKVIKPDIKRVDSPAVYLEEGPLAFERVEMDDKFRTYLCWSVGNQRIVLARIDWSCKGEASLIGQQTGDCGSEKLQRKNWQLVLGSAAQNASPAIIGPLASPPPPIKKPDADKDTKWDLC
jgi:hypothetical protein